MILRFVSSKFSLRSILFNSDGMEDMYVGGRGPLDNMRSLEQYLPDPGGHRGQGMSIILHF